MWGGTSPVEVDTTANMTDSFLASKGVYTSETFDVTQKLCFEFQNFSKINQYQVTMMIEKAKSRGNCSIWIEQWHDRVTGSSFYRILHLRETPNKENTLKDLLGYCPVSTEKHPPQFQRWHGKETSALQKTEKNTHGNDYVRMLSYSWSWIVAPRILS